MADPPRLIAVPLTVIELFASLAFVTAPLAIVNAVELPVLPVPVTSPVNVNDPLGIDTVAVVSAVTRPYASVVITGIAVDDPTVCAVPVAVNVIAPVALIVTLPAPLDVLVIG